MSESKEKTFGPFDFIKAIRNKSGMEFSAIPENIYNPFLTNRALSFDKLSLFQANEMNMYQSLPKKAQYDFYLNSIAKKLAYSAWIKQEKDSDLDVLKKYYSCSYQKAKEIASILTEEQFNMIKEKYRNT